MIPNRYYGYIVQEPEPDMNFVQSQPDIQKGPDSAKLGLT